MGCFYLCKNKLRMCIIQLHFWNARGNQRTGIFLFLKKKINAYKIFKGMASCSVSVTENLPRPSNKILNEDVVTPRVSRPSSQEDIINIRVSE